MPKDMNRICSVCSKPINGKQVKYCGNACKQKSHYHRIKEQTNTYFSQTKRGLLRKMNLIEEKGGKCESCGYNHNLGALQFHHIDPNEKKMKLDMRTLSNNKLEKIKAESKKCILLCGNCHVEHHHPELTMSDLKITLNNW